MLREFYKINVMFIFMIISVIIVEGAYANTYYVDFSSGSDTNNGISTGTPFKHCPGDASATANANRTLSAGDTVYFKGGVTYTGSISLNWSGSSDSSRIVYDGNSAGTWGVGRAILNGASPPGTVTAAFYESSARSYLTFKNFEVTAYYNGYGGGMINVVVSTHNGLVFDGNYIHETGYWENDGHSVDGAALFLPLCTSCNIKNNIIKKTGMVGIHFNGGTNSTITNNTIGEYIVWGIDLAGDYGINNNITISGNTIYDLYHHDLGYWRASSEPPHTDFIFLRGDGTDNKCPKNITIEKNYFYNNATFTNNGGTAMIYNGCIGNTTGRTDNVTIRNNVFSNPHSYSTLSSYTDATNFKIYNNTFYGGGNAIHIPGNTQVLNNAVVSDIVIHWSGSGLPIGATIDYNYYCSTNGQPFKQDGPYNQMTFALWKSNYGQDAHSTLTTNCSSMKFNNVSGYPAYSGALDLSLQSSSPLINTGTTISFFSTDRLGVARPIGSAWDIGAYESTSVTRIMIPNTPTITYLK